MRISFKYAILSVVAGAVFVVALLMLAPMVLKGVLWAGRAPDPTEAEACTHLASLGLTIEDCPAWLESGRADLGDLYPNRLRCYAAAADVASAKRCDDVVELSTDRWAR